MADFWTGVGDLLGLNKGKATIAAAGKNDALLSDLATKGQGYLDQSKDLTGQYLSDVNKGSGLYLDALGANGPGGNASATAAFQHSPGYQQALDEGQQSIMRSAAARGDLGGGQTSIDLLKYGVGAADADWGNWLSRLGGIQAQQSGAVGGQTKSLGDLTQFAQDIASGRISSNNQEAGGKEAGQGWGIDLLSNLAKIGGSFAGYGGFGGGNATAGSGALSR